MRYAEAEVGAGLFLLYRYSQTKALAFGETALLRGFIAGSLEFLRGFLFHLVVVFMNLIDTLQVFRQINR